MVVKVVSIDVHRLRRQRQAHSSRNLYQHWTKIVERVKELNNYKQIKTNIQTNTQTDRQTDTWQL